MAALVVFVFDTHIGSTVGLCAKTVELEDQSYPASDGQLWLLEHYEDFKKQVKAAAYGKQVILILGGDLKDGARHHGTFQTWGTDIEQVRAAVQLLLPLANLASDIYGLKDTQCHGGMSGADDAAIVKELGGECRYRWRLDIEGLLFDVAHHSRRDAREWALGGSTLSLLRNTVARCEKYHERKPDFVIRGHGHQFDVLEQYDKATDHTMTAVRCPAWQLATENTRRIDPASLADIGGLLWTRESGLRPILYKGKPDPVTVVPIKPPNDY